jgi:hypothetical protein
LWKRSGAPSHPGSSKAALSYVSFTVVSGGEVQWWSAKPARHGQVVECRLQRPSIDVLLFTGFLRADERRHIARLACAALLSTVLAAGCGAGYGRPERTADRPAAEGDAQRVAVAEVSHALNGGPKLSEDRSAAAADRWRAGPSRWSGMRRRGTRRSCGCPMARATHHDLADRLEAGRGEIAQRLPPSEPGRAACTRR